MAAKHEKRGDSQEKSIILLFLSYQGNWLLTGKENVSQS